MTISQRLAQAAQQAARTRALAGGDASLARAVRRVKDWQAYRLTRTYPDLLETPRYREPALFFLQDLYGPGDHLQRDSELARVIPALVRFLPEQALETVCEAIELDALSEALDCRVAQQLLGYGEPPPDGPGVRPIPVDHVVASDRDGLRERFDRHAYAAAYRAAGTPAERRLQIERVGVIGRSLDRLVRKPLLSGLIASMGPAARVAGLGAMHEFLQRGFRAFKAMGGASEFLALIDARERRISEALFAGDDSVLPE